MEEEGGVAGIFDAKIDGAREQRLPQDRGRPEPQPVHDWNARAG